MATILFAAAGAALGAGFGGTVLGLSGAVMGRAVGATIGRAVDQRIIGLGSDAVEVGKLERFQVMGASEGTPIPKFWGRMRLSGQVIWASPFQQTSRKSGGKGTPTPKQVQYSYSVGLAIALCEGEILGVGRVWADGDELSLKPLNMRVYHGTEDQLPDPLIEAQLGNALAPAYRGTAYVVIEQLELSAYGNRVPQFSFEVVRRGQGKEAEKSQDFPDLIKAVALIPGTGEYSLATKKVYEGNGFGRTKAINVNTLSGETDFVTSIDQLKTELPDCQAVSLVVSWFGSDLRCGECKVQPKVENSTRSILQAPLRFGGVPRSEAQSISRVDGRPIYGGTPADATIIDAIRYLSELGKSVMFYPFILMEQIDGNNLPDPYSRNGFQATMPWRGRITLSIAPGDQLSPDGTDEAVSQVEAFFGTADRNDFLLQDSEVIYTGEPVWSYRRFILHYAHLCKVAGGVEAFCIGSEMRGLTQIRGAEHRFPAVELLIKLAGDVKSILGDSVKISYGADWSEYFGYHVDNNVYFHLDPLWADRSIDFIGVDNYMPISDWREGSDHLDASWRSIYNLDYLQSNIGGGEGYDWYYSSIEDYLSQNRSAINDTSYGEDWIFKYKDLKSWWSKCHHNRIDGIRLDVATSWIPASKPIRFTEYGCAAVDMATNEPNKFLDLRSSESCLPRGSLGVRDDFIQLQYFRAMANFWSDETNNPISTIYGGSMLDIDHLYAWAWDSRPYPEFPRNTDVWSDGESYYLGHWLNGRVASVPLEQVVREICEDCGVNYINDECLFGTVYGYVTAFPQTGRAKLQPLTLVNGFDCVDARGELVFEMRGHADAFEISTDCLLEPDSRVSGLERTRAASLDSVSKVRLSYVASDGNFPIMVAEVISSDSTLSTILETEFNMSLPDDIASEVVARWMVESTLSRDQVSVDLPMSILPDVPSKSLLYKGLTYRIDRTEIDERLSVRGVRVEPSAYRRIAPDVDRKEWIPHSASGLIDCLWMDLPILDSSQNPAAPFLALASDPWRGPALVWMSNDDNDYSINSQFASSTHIGHTLSDLYSCRSGVVDRGSALIVSMQSTNLESTSLNGLLSGKNLIAIGGGRPDEWEILQFLNSELISSGVFALTFRLRGLRGSDSTMPTLWPAGSHVVVIDAGLGQISLSVDQLNVEKNYRVGFYTEDIGSDLIQHYTNTARGSGFRPLSVGHLRCQVGAQGSHQFRWMRRSRFGGDSWDGFEVPLNEDREIYLLVVRSLDGDVLLREFLEKQEFTFTLDRRLEAGVVGLYSVEVSQVSSVYGIGPKTVCVVEYT